MGFSQVSIAVFLSIKCFIPVLHICTSSVKPVEEKAPLVIELIQSNRWRQARRPEDLEAANDDEASVKKSKACNSVQQTGDVVVDAAVKELLAGTYYLIFTFNTTDYWESSLRLQ